MMTESGEQFWQTNGFGFYEYVRSARSCWRMLGVVVYGSTVVLEVDLLRAEVISIFQTEGSWSHILSAQGHHKADLTTNCFLRILLALLGGGCN